MKRPDWLKLSPPVVFGLVAVGVLGLGWVVICLPQLQTASLRKGVEDYRSSLPKPDPEKLATLEKGRLEVENAIRTGLIQGIGGTVLLIGLYFTYQNLRATQRNVAIAEAKQVTDRKTAEANLKLAEAKQVTDRFSTAVGMLSHASSMHTRLGGIYALERIARDSDDDYWQVMEVLTAFVREASPWPPKTEKTESEGVTVEAKCADPVAEAAIEQPVVEGKSSQYTVLQLLLSEPELSERKRRRQALEQALEQGLKKLEELKEVAKLSHLRTDIQAVMTVIGRRQPRTEQAKKQELDLSKTDLRRLQSQGANLTGVNLEGAHLELADLGEAHLKHAFLLETHLLGTNLSGAHLELAYLSGAHLECTDLSGAHLETALLTEAHLEQANLLGSHLEGADLSGADLSQVIGLTQAQLDSALTDEHTILPDYLLATQPPPQAPIAPPSLATPEPNSEPQPPAT